MIYKYASLYEVLNKVHRDTGSLDDIHIEDLIEWAGEALDQIGAYQQFIRKVTGDKANPHLDVTNYKAKLPCDVYRIEQVSVNGKHAVYAGNTFNHLLDGSCCTNAVEIDNYRDLFYDNFGNVFSNVAPNNFDNRYYEPYAYDVNDNYITLNVKEGKVCLAYIAIPLDENGFPLIPDDVSYREAISRYCIMKIMYINWIKGRVGKDIYEHSEQKWHWYCAQAKGKAVAPSLDKMEQIKRRFLKLIPEIHQHKTFFKK